MRFSLNRQIIAYLLLAGILLCILYAAGRYFLPGKTTPGFITTTVKRTDIQDTVLASGTLEALQQVSVGAQVSGQLKSLKVALGDQVKKGQLIAEIDSLPQQNAFRNAQAERNQVRAQLRAKQASLRQAELLFKRKQRLLDVDAGSREEFENAQAALHTAEADIAALKAQIAQAGIAVDTKALDLGYTKISAPIDGKVVAVVTKQGQTVNSAQQAPTIIILAELDRMLVKAKISEADVVKVKPGQAVYFTILGDPDQRYHASLHSVEPASDTIGKDSDSQNKSNATAAPVYYNALFEVPNPDHTLRIAMTAQVTIVLQEAKDALTIPSSALENGGKAGKDGWHDIRVLSEDGKVDARKIRIGLRTNLHVQVLEGLKAGEKVIHSDAAGKDKQESGMTMISV